MKKRIPLLCAAILMGFVFGSFGYISQQFHSPPEGQYFISNGKKIHYTVDGQGDPVLLLHGYAVNGNINWRQPGIIDFLSNHYQVITIDHRGHGLSEKPRGEEDYGIHLVYDAINLMDHLEMEKAHLVGYSMGGFISIKLASLYPERWQSISIMASGWEHPDFGRGCETLEAVRQDIESGRGLGPVISRYAEDTNPGWAETAFVSVLTRYFNDIDAMQGVILGGLELGVYPEQMACINLPVCTIIGEEDPFLGASEGLVNALTNVEFCIVEGADHASLPMNAYSKEVLLDFLQAH